MATLAKLVIKLITDVSEFEAGVQASAKKITKLGDDMQKLGGTLDKYVTLPLLAAGLAAVKFSSDLNESVNKANVVFGESSKKIMDFSKDASTAMGMSKQKAIDAAGGFGTLFTTMGIGKDKSADMSIELVKLASDLGSFNNISTDDALQKLKSGLVGETEPLRSVGVLLDQNAIKAKAMAMGLIGVGQELTPAAKATASYALILEQTKIQQGDFANTADGLANSTKIMTSSLEDLAANLGTTLLPMARQIVSFLTGFLQAFNNLPPSVQQGIVYFAMFAASLGPILTVGGNLITLFGTITGAFATGGALAGVGTFFAGLVPSLTAAGPALGGIAAGFGAILGPALAIGLAIAGLIIVIVLFGKQAMETLGMIGQIIDALITGIGDKLAEIDKSITDAVRGAVYGIGDFIAGFFTAGANLIAGFINGILTMAASVVQTVSDVVTWTIEAVEKLLRLGSPSKVFSDMGKNTMLGFAAGVDKFASVPVNATMEAVGGIIPAAQSIQPAGSGRAVSIGPISFQGDLSETQKASLEVWINQIFGESMSNLLEST